MLGTEGHKVIHFRVEGLELAVTAVEGALELLLGWTAETVLAERGFLVSRVPPQDRGLLLERAYAAAAGKGANSCVHRLIRADGEARWFLTSIRRAGSGLELLSVDVDDLKRTEEARRTERQRAEEELRQSEVSYRLLVDSVRAVGVLALSPDGEIRSWNPGAQRLMQHRAPEMVGQPLARLFEPEEAERARELVQRAAVTGSAQWEGWLVRKDGTRLWALLMMGAIEDEGRRLQGIAMVLRDLTERVRAERAQAFLADAGAALARSLAFNDVLAESCRVGLPLLGRACVVHLLDGERLSPASVAHEEEAARSKLLQALSTLPAGQGAMFGVAQVVESSQAERCPQEMGGRWMAAALGAKPGALEALGLASYVCLPLASRGRAFGALTLLRGMDQPQHAQHEVALAERLARRVSNALDNARLYEQAQRAIGTREEVLAVVSHDLRNPLHTIRMGAVALARAPVLDREAVSSIADRILRSCHRMELMIRDLLDFSSLDSGQLTIEQKPCEVGKLVADAMEIFRPMALERRLTLVAEVDMPEQRVRCDPHRVAQVFSNLVSNALRHTDPGGQVVVAAQHQGDEVLFTVRDTGEGIEADELPHIFDRYWRGEHARGRGHGLGLPITKGIIEAHGGTIRVESRKGEGTAFSFTLKLASAEPAGLEPPHGPSA